MDAFCEGPNGSFRNLPEIRKLIIQLHRQNFSAERISLFFKSKRSPVSVQAVHALISKYKSVGNFADRPRTGRPKKSAQEIIDFIDAQT